MGAMPEGTRRGRVIGRTALTPRVTELLVRVEGDEPFHWLAGQHVRLRLDVPDAEESFFSIAASPTQAGLGTLVLAVANGSDLLGRTAVGTALFVDGPFGSLVWHPAPGALFVGAGTGVAPLRAIVHDALAAAETGPLVLVSGNRARADLLWHEELRALENEHPRFHYEPVLSLSELGWSGRRGHVQEHVPAAVATLPGGFRAYLCGSTRMVADCRAVLDTLGVPDERILSEADA
jgi:3-phenylpropionate/trans-cinnamate dioxygenase ferredoxin reductase subunit